MEEVKKKQPISISEVKGILSKNNVDEMDQFQRWTFDYVTKFSVLEPNDAKKIRQRLVKECELSEEVSAYCGRSNGKKTPIPLCFSRYDGSIFSLVQAIRM